MNFVPRSNYQLNVVTYQPQTEEKSDKFSHARSQEVQGNGTVNQETKDLGEWSLLIKQKQSLDCNSAWLRLAEQQTQPPSLTWRKGASKR